jgi:hypothetical protein
VTEAQVNELLGTLGRIADAFESNRDLYSAHLAEDARRYAVNEERYHEEKRIQAEAIERNKRSLATLLRQDDRAQFSHDYLRTTLGLRAPDVVPEGMEKS